MLCVSVASFRRPACGSLAGLAASAALTNKGQMESSLLGRAERCRAGAPCALCCSPLPCCGIFSGGWGGGQEEDGQLPSCDLVPLCWCQWFRMFALQPGRQGLPKGQKELWGSHSFCVCIWFMSSVKSSTCRRCLMCPHSQHCSLVGNNTCIDLITAFPAENQCSGILQISRVRVPLLT